MLALRPATFLVRNTRRRLAGRCVPEALRPEKKTPLGHHHGSRLKPLEHSVQLAGERTKLHRALDECPLLVRHRDEDHLAPADALDSRTWDGHHTFPARG